jgi:hypothetical protein
LPRSSRCAPTKAAAPRHFRVRRDENVAARGSIGQKLSAMNFHQGQVPGATAPHNGVRYEPVPRDEHPQRANAVERLAAFVTAPVVGSRWIFPRRFDRAFEILSQDRAPAKVIPEHAVWYYGSTLHLEVDPARLTHRISDWVRDTDGARWVGASFLDAADWSAAITPLERSPIHREMQEIVAAGKDVRDTRAYRNLLHAIKLGRPSFRNNIRLASVEAVEAYLHYCRDLIKSMRKRGVVRHSETFAFHRLRVKHRDARSPVHDSTERDIGVAIADDGALIRHLGGKHRTAIAQALQLPSLPVEIRMVHADWLARQIERTGLPPHRALAEGIRSLVANGKGDQPAAPRS